MSNERETLRVFISYARRDGSGFAEELLSGLEVAGFEAFLDRHDIAAGEEWEARLGGLIESADTVVYVLTPASVASERCKWEVDKAAALAKRVIPIVAIDVAEADTPDALKRLNYIFFSAGHSYSKSLGDLAKALRVDLGWIREHTRLGEVARRWQERDKNEVLLLRGPELEAARAWLTQWRAPAPEPTDLHRAFIAASEAAEGAVLKRERARARTLLIAVSALGLVFAGFAAISGMLYLRAQESEAIAYQNQLLAEQATERANAAALAAGETAARALLYEGLYWLKAGNDGSRGRLQNDDWSKALIAFRGGLEALGASEAVVEGQSLHELLTYGERFVYLCGGFGALDSRVSPQGVRDYYSAIRMPSCTGGIRPRPVRPPD